MIGIPTTGVSNNTKVQLLSAVGLFVLFDRKNLYSIEKVLLTLTSSSNENHSFTTDQKINTVNSVYLSSKYPSNEYGKGGNSYEGSMYVGYFTTNRIITISREFGSGGRTIAKEVAAKLQIPCYDSEIIEKIATKTGFAKEYIEKYGEYTVTDNLYDNALAGRTYNGQSDADKLWLAQKEVIVNLAKEGSCVIVGRCADYILQDMADCITVFIHASDEYRQNRIVSVYGEREETPVKRLHDKDKKRKAYYELYTGTQWGKVDGYQLCLDSEKIGIPKCVDMICSLYQN